MGALAEWQLTPPRTPIAASPLPAQLETKKSAASCCQFLIEFDLQAIRRAKCEQLTSRLQTLTRPNDTDIHRWGRTAASVIANRNTSERKPLEAGPWDGVSDAAD